MPPFNSTNLGVEILLELKNVNVRFGGLHAVKDFNMMVKKGEIHSLIGPNGAGKTTVFNAITKIVKVETGKIFIEGQDLSRFKAHEIVKLGISRTFQNIILFKYMTVMENILIGYHSRYKSAFFNEIFGGRKYLSERLKAFSRVLDIADLLDLKNRLSSLALNLPYGVQKIVEIGRALMSEPKLLLLDEPAAGLTENETEELKKIIEKINKDWNITVLLVEHDMSVVMNISNQITVMDFGRKIAEGRPEEIKSNPEVIKAYLGEKYESSLR
ncbi:MAG: branched-chain amino acid transport system ATP-binding protein [Thermotogaceae bacterium]|nr:branched-chain amino acid transport system ATP-binding protein [Thermotogaceae bacterium]MDN5337904.1 branched-chain amino acid transport system ATP-binding protein [Thermotogaceae bacterium]